MKKNKKMYGKFLEAFFILQGCFFAGLVIYYIIFLSKGYYHSDCTDTIFWAQASYESGSLMNPEFRYAGLMPFGGQLIMLPFVAMFGVGLKAQIMGMIVFFWIFLLAVMFICKSMGLSNKWSAVTISVLLLLLSSGEKIREIFWGHIIYYSLGSLFLLAGLALVFNIIKAGRVLETERDKKKIRQFIILNVLLALITIMCSMNGVQLMVLYVLPVLAALAAEWFFDVKTGFWDKKSRVKYLIMTILVISAVIGLFFGKLANGGIEAWYEEAYSSFSEPEEWVENLFSFFPEFFTLLGVKVTDSTLMYSFAGICNLLRIIFALVLLTIPFIMLFMYKKFEDVRYRLMILTHHFLAVFILAGWVFGKLGAANWRLSPLVVTSVLLCMMFLKWMWQHISYKRMMAIVVIPLMLMMLIVTKDIVTMEKQSETNRQLVQLTKYLEDNNLKYGYATFWNANIVTLLSDSRVKVRDISLDETNGYVERAYQSNENWYAKAGGYDKYFVILTGSEYEDWIEQGVYEQPEEILNCGWYQILVYGHNLF